MFRLIFAIAIATMLFMHLRVPQHAEESRWIAGTPELPPVRVFVAGSFVDDRQNWTTSVQQAEWMIKKYAEEAGLPLVFRAGERGVLVCVADHGPVPASGTSGCITRMYTTQAFHSVCVAMQLIRQHFQPAHEPYLLVYLTNHRMHIDCMLHGNAGVGVFYMNESAAPTDEQHAVVGFRYPATPQEITDEVLLTYSVVRMRLSQIAISAWERYPVHSNDYL